MNGIKKPLLGGMKLKLPAMPAAPTSAPTASLPSIKSPMKVGTSLTVKTPKSKSMPDATDKPSVFFKTEGLQKQKHPSVQKLRDFLDKKHKKTIL